MAAGSAQLLPPDRCSRQRVTPAHCSVGCPSLPLGLSSGSPPESHCLSTHLPTYWVHFSLITYDFHRHHFRKEYAYKSSLSTNLQAKKPGILLRAVELSWGGLKDHCGGTQ